MNVLVWITRSLRIADHPALAHAAGLGRVLPVFVADPARWALPDMAGRHWGFVAESLLDLREQMAGIGLPLIVRRGETRVVLAGLARAHRITTIVTQDGGDDGRVADWARGAGIAWVSLPDGPADLPATIAAIDGVEPGLIPDARGFGLGADRCPQRQGGGRGRGLALLDSFMARRAEGYRATLGSPVVAEGAGSRLSPHLAWGTLSANEVGRATATRRADRPGGAWTGALRSFQTRIALRDRAAGTAPSAGQGKEAHLAAWQAGETGFPYVDACLRYLALTGWLPYRARALVAGVALGQLGLDPAAAGMALARLCTDYDPAIHWSEIAIAGQRAPDPVRQGRLQDPEGRMIRRYVPELASVPDAYLHAPWLWSGSQDLLERRYPRPLAAPAPAARSLSAPRAARPRSRDSRQLSFDL